MQPGSRRLSACKLRNETRTSSSCPAFIVTWTASISMSPPNWINDTSVGSIVQQSVILSASTTHDYRLLLDHRRLSGLIDRPDRHCRSTAWQGEKPGRLLCCRPATIDLCHVRNDA